MTQEGIVTSPNFPRAYDNNQLCSTVITAGAGQTVTLSFVTFSVEDANNCGFDSLKIYDGSSRGSNRLGKFCDTELPATITSTGRSLLLRFRTDDSHTQDGFLADVTFSSGRPINTYTAWQTTVQKVTKLSKNVKFLNFVTIFGITMRNEFK